jgi:hypothetical protein
MTNDTTSTKEHNAAKEKTGGGWMGRIVRLFRDENRFLGGHYIVKGIEVNLPFGKLRIGRTIMLPKVKPPSILYIGKRHTWTWTIRVRTVAISYLPNAEV